MDVKALQKLFLRFMDEFEIFQYDIKMQPKKNIYK